MVDTDAKISVRRQCELLKISRSGFLYKQKETPEEDLALMRAFDGDDDLSASPF